MDMGGDRSLIRRGLRVALKAFSSATEFTSLLDLRGGGGGDDGA